MSPTERERRPGGRGAESSRGREGKAKRSTRYTPGPPDPEYDIEAGDAEGYETDSLTADEWSAACLARPLAAYRGSNGKWRYAG